MAETFVLSFVEKLMLLEKAAGAGVHYQIMPPISAPICDPRSAQKVAHQIADSIALSRFQIIVTFAKQKYRVGGHIDLSTKGDEVFIEIDPDAIAFPGSVEATLCHEICHKWLQVNGISSPIEMDNEILTDITTVFLGFGKIMLNGCEVKTVKVERIGDGKRTTTATHTCGYLKRDQFAFAYRLVCAMRNVPPTEYMRGLSPDAASAICSCDSSFSSYYTPRFHEVETIEEPLKRFRADRGAQHRQVAELNKNLEYIKRSFCETVDGFITVAYRALEKLSQGAGALGKETHHDPVLRFLAAIKKEHELEQMAQELASVGNRLKELLSDSTVIGRLIWKNSNRFPAPSPTMFNIIKCPKDGTRLRLPEDSPDLVVTCPTCHYRFPYDTTCISFQTSSSKGTNDRPSSSRRSGGGLKLAAIVLGAGLTVVVVPLVSLVQKASLQSAPTAKQEPTPRVTTPELDAIADSFVTNARPTTRRSSPWNGQVLRSFSSLGFGRISVDNGTTKDAVVKLMKPGSHSADCAFYVSAGRSASVENVPDGTYSVLFALGSDWDGIQRFRLNESFGRFNRALAFVTDPKSFSYTTYSLTLYPSIGENPKTSIIERSEFENH